MSTKTKRFRIGEYAIGGIIEARVTKEEPDRELVEVKALEWNNPSRVVMSDWAETDAQHWNYKIDNTLNEMTTSYYSDTIMEWINEQLRVIKKQKQSI